MTPKKRHEGTYPETWHDYRVKNAVWKHDIASHNMTQHYTAKQDTKRDDITLRDLTWHDTRRHEKRWHNATWGGMSCMTWQGMTRPDMTREEMTRPDMTQEEMTWYDVKRRDMTGHDATRHGQIPRSFLLKFRLQTIGVLLKSYWNAYADLNSNETRFYYPLSNIYTVYNCIYIYIATKPCWNSICFFTILVKIGFLLKYYDNSCFGLTPSLKSHSKSTC